MGGRPKRKESKNGNGTDSCLSQLNSKEIQEIIKKSADPHALGAEDPEMRPGRKGMVITAMSKQGLSNQEALIRTDKDLFNRLTTVRLKEKLLQVKVVGIQEELTKQELVMENN